MLNVNESSHFKKFLDELSDYQGNTGCNDYELECTEENYKLLRQAYIYNDRVNPDGNDLKHDLRQLTKEYDSGKKLFIMDFMLLDYLRNKAGF